MSDYPAGDFAAWAAELPGDIEDRVRYGILRDAVRRAMALREQYPDESRMPPGEREELAGINRLADRL